jgi:hypothetical protein
MTLIKQIQISVDQQNLHAIDSKEEEEGTFYNITLSAYPEEAAK